MSILITGRDGQVARSLQERGAGHELVFAARPDMDLLDPASIERSVAAAHPELVISAAAFTAVDQAEREPELAMQVNGTAPGVLAAAAHRCGAPIIHLSTDYVFDGSLDRPYREDDPVAPLGAYGRSKLAGEEAVRASGARYLIARTAWVYGPFGANFLKTMLRLGAEREEVNVVDDQIGCPTSSLDLADAILAVVGAWQSSPGAGADQVYHVAGTGEASWADFAHGIFAASAQAGGPAAAVRGIPTSAWPTPAARPANSRLDSGKFAAAFGHRLPHWRQSTGQVVSRSLRG